MNENTFLNSLSDNIPDIEAEDLAELAEVAPYINPTIKAYRFLKKQRIKRFLMTLDKKSSEDFGEKERDKLLEYLSSPEGQEILGEFIDSVHQTSSVIANTALALLYADFESKKYDKAFKLSAVLALRNIDDETVKAFLSLTDEDFLQRRKKEDGPYPVYILEVSDTGGETNPELYAPHLEMLVEYVHILITKGFLLPDYSSARWGGDKDTTQPYGVGQRSKKYRELLKEASEYSQSTQASL